MKWIKRILAGIGGLLVIAAVLPFFVSLDSYLPRIERTATERLRTPVSIHGVRLSLLPLPHVTVDGIKVGENAGVAMESVRITPDLPSLLGPTYVISSIEVEGLVLTQKGVDSIPLWTRPEAPTANQGPPAVRVKSFHVRNAMLKTDRASFGPFNAHLNLSDSGEPEDAAISSVDGKLNATIKPDASGYLFEAAAKAWTLPAGPAIVFDELTVKGAATLKDADLKQINARLYGGTLAGHAAVVWGKRMQLSGRLDIDRVELRQIVSMFAPKTHIIGKLRAHPVFSASAVEAKSLADALRLDTPFEIQNGAIQGVDIQKAATSIVTRGASGGETRFDQLSGNLSLEHNAFRFTNLRIASGALAVDGNFNISEKKELSGRINAQVKVLGTSAGVPLNVAGTTDSPLLYPTGSTMTGAAVGTALMGPGVGTALGAKAGNFVEGLFGKKDPPAQKK